MDRAQSSRLSPCRESNESLKDVMVLRVKLACTALNGAGMDKLIEMISSVDETVLTVLYPQEA